MENRDEKKLFWYGWRANLKKAFGKFLIIMGIIIGLIFMFINVWLGVIILIILVGFGIYLLAKGSSQYFDYKRASGHILYEGDN